MNFRTCNVYRATFDLVVEGNLQQEPQPCEERLLVAADLDEAYDMAKAMRGQLRWGAVHKETVVRDITLVHLRVMVTAEERESAQNEAFRQVANLLYGPNHGIKEE